MKDSDGINGINRMIWCATGASGIAVECLVDAVDSTQRIAAQRDPHQLVWWVNELDGQRRPHHSPLFRLPQLR